MMHRATDEFIDRVQSSYKIAVERLSQDKGHVWQAIDGLRLPIHHALLAEGRETVRNMLNDPVTTDLFYGMDNLALSLEKDMARDPDADAHLAAAARGALLRLGEALGVRKLIPPEAQAHFYAQNPSAGAHDDVERILDEAERVCGFPVDFPGAFRGERGWRGRRGLCSVRAAAALYQAFRVKQELGSAAPGRVLEIGPGMGRTMYYAHRAEMACTTVDLPLGVVAQACFLGATLGPDAVWMVGDAMPARGRVRLLPGSSLPALEERFDVVLNVDSLVEVGAAEAAAYAAWIGAHAGVFLSINHESEAVHVTGLIRSEMEAAYHARFPYRFIDGHTEEIVRMGWAAGPREGARAVAPTFARRARGLFRLRG